MVGVFNYLGLVETLVPLPGPNIIAYEPVQILKNRKHARRPQELFIGKPHNYLELPVVITGALSI
jgi:hypothetical protein